MDRRDFIKRGAVGATGLAAGARPEQVAGKEPPAAALLSSDEMDTYLKKVDEGGGRILRWPLAEQLQLSGALAPEREELARKAMYSLYMAGMFGDLHIENQLHPGMQDRLWAAAPIMDAALDEMADFLSSRPAEHLDSLRAVMRDRPEVSHRLITLVDEEALGSGVSEPRRAQLRAMFTDTGWRLGNQPPSLVIDEYLGRVDRVTVSDVDDLARERWLMSRVSEEVFWQAQESLRQQRINKGLRRMGIGAALFAGGALLVSLGDNGGDGGSVIQWIGLIPGITGGSVLFVIGFFTLLAGLVTSEDAQSGDTGSSGESR